MKVSSNFGRALKMISFFQAGAIESHLAIKTKTLKSYSEQQLVDCVKNNHGCNGGWPSNAFGYVAKNGINLEKDYPYENANKTCRYNKMKEQGHVKSYVNVRAGDEKKLKEAVGLYGPVTICIAIKGFQFYKQGVFYEKDCPKDKAEHAVLVVGYGSQSGSDYWIVKNSWGQNWGEKGYIKMARNKDNLCGVASVASYPVVN